MVSAAEPQWGPALVGVFISLILYGIILCQTFFYYRNYSSDTRKLRGFVGIVVFTDTIHSLFSMILIYDVLVAHYDDPGDLAESHWLFNSYPSFVGIISCAVQLFFTWRVKILTGYFWLPGAIAFMCLMNLAGGLVISIEAGHSMMFTDFKNFRRLVLAWLLISMTAEIILTCVLTRFLRKPGLFLGSSNDLMKRISRLTLSNGLITTIWTSGIIICYFQGGIGTHLIFCYPLAKLYITSMLSTLNTRPSFHDQHTRTRPNNLNMDDTQLKSGLSFIRKRASSYSVVESQTPVLNAVGASLVHRYNWPLYDSATAEAGRTEGEKIVQELRGTQ